MICVRDLTLMLGAHVAVSDVSFEAGVGGFICLVGPNGAGKSSLLKAVAGVLAPASGSVDVNGAQVGQLRPGDRARHIAWLPQSRPVAWNLRTEDIVALGRYAGGGGTYEQAHKDERSVMDAAMVKAGADGLRGRPIHDLSGGEQARVHLARLLASSADCLLLDEPCAALDIAHQLSLMEVLSAEAQGGRLVIAAMHDLSLAARFADRVIVLNGGQLVADGTPATALTADILSSVFGVRKEDTGELTRL